MSAILEVFAWIMSGVARLIASAVDRRRITRSFAERGYVVASITWAPLSTGWLSNWYDRFYIVEFQDDERVHKTTTCHVG